MKELILHLWQENREEIIAKSLLHCHTNNLHSIMLLNCPGKTIRLYIAEPGNELHKNYYTPANYNPIIALHAHHCNLRLHCIHGELTDIEFRKKDKGEGILMDAFKFNSYISGKDGSFERVGQQLIKPYDHTVLKQYQSIYHKASDIHTVAVPINSWAAWVVMEGQEDPEYDALAYSISDLTEFDTTGLYLRPDEKIIKELLDKII